MRARQCLTVLAIAALAAVAAGAAARPSANDIEEVAKPYLPDKSFVAPKPSTGVEERSSTAEENKPATIEAATLATIPKATPATNLEATPAIAQEVAPVTTSEVTTATIQKIKPFTVPEVKSDSAVDVKPVNERFPHAVLFGGTCGGSIISDTWILTAGHCTLFSSGYRVLAGTNNTDDGTGELRFVKRMVIHPKFSVGPYWLDADEFNIKQVAARWDFLLVELEQPLTLDGKKIAAAKLDERKTLPEGLHVGYAGYGTDHFGGTMRSQMHGMELAVQSDATCSTLQEYNAQDMFCVKGRPPRMDSACNGDSGSGLVDESGNLLGVASWVENDAHACANGALVFFSRVSAVRDWIRQVTNI